MPVFWVKHVRCVFGGPAGICIEDYADTMSNDHILRGIVQIARSQNRFIDDC